MLSSLVDNVLTTTTTLSNSKDLYELRLWSNEITNDGFKYMIEVTD